jgi:hypothetical protein
MTTQTMTVLESVLASDSTISPQERRKIIKRMATSTSAEPEANGHAQVPRVYSYPQAQEALGGRSKAYIHQLVQRGLLERFTPRGNKRSIGITGKSLQSFIEGGQTQATA